ncbi:MULTISPECIES: transporter substrate-binding domain-containing protein [unclassified Clostridium]|uniref:transporter substrate-binding domain-containing protein n=1 Tax=Clostridium TaxID=1485 RepID=UPI000EE6757D|nr:amino acid ABC transporter [Clostridium sp.]
MKKGILKKIFALAMVGTMSLSLMACGNKEEVDLLSKIKKEGKLKVGMSVDYAPYEFFIMENGEKKTVGLDISLVSEIAKDLGVEYEIQEMEFSTICDATRNGIIDLGVSGLSVNEERKEVIDFSNIYFQAEQGILINKNNSETIKSIDDLKGKKVGAQNGSTQATLAQGIENADVKLLAQVPTLIQDLIAGNLDAVIVELPVADIQAIVHEELAVAKEKINDTSGGGSAIALPKGQATLLEAVNKTLERLESEGKIQEFYKEAIKLSKDEVTAQ